MIIVGNNVSNTEDRLLQEFNKNTELFQKYREQQDIAFLSSLKVRLERAKAGAIISYFFAAVAAIFMTNNPFIYYLISFGFPAVTSLISDKLYDKKHKITKKLREFSNAKTSYEKLLVETESALEAEKYHYRNKIIFDTLSLLDKEQPVIETDNNSNTNIPIDNNLHSLNEELQTKLDEFDKLVRQQELLKRSQLALKDSKLNHKGFIDYSLYSFAGMLYLCLPYICWPMILENPPLLSLTGIISAFVLPFAGIPLIAKLREKQLRKRQRKVFNKLVDKDLPRSKPYLENKINNLIREISTIKVKVEKIKEQYIHDRSETFSKSAERISEKFQQLYDDEEEEKTYTKKR